MPDQRHAFAGADMQRKIRQHRLIRCITKVYVVELDVAAQVAYRPVAGLYDDWLGIHQRKDALGGAQRPLELAPKGGEVEHGEPETVYTVDKEKPGPGSDGPGVDAGAAEVEQE